MTRIAHEFLGLAAALLVAVLTTTGAWLAGAALLDEARAPATPPGASVADVARIAATLPGLERIDRRPSGAVVATYFEGDVARQATIDVEAGATRPAPDVSRVSVTMRNLHRRLLLGDAGQATAGLGAAAMLILSLTGVALLARRLGGWRNLTRPIRGDRAQRLHGGLARLAAIGLILSAASGVAMSAASFSLLPDPERAQAPPATSSEGPRRDVGAIPELRAMPLAALRGLQFPVADDPADVYTLTSAAGEATIDAVSGATLTRAVNGSWRRVYEVIYALHAGELAWPATLALALSSAAAPILIAAGVLSWASRRRLRMPGVTANAPAQGADTILLVGSEGGSTWDFAETLRAALTAQGARVHVAAMNDLAPAYRAARRLIVLAATYGEGDAPASATRFLSRLDGWRGGALDCATLAFGDRQFPHFCGYGDKVAAALAERGLRPMLAPARIDRQSSQSFADWGRALGAALGVRLELTHVPARPKTMRLALVGRVDYGAAVGAPTAVLRFAPAPGARWPRFRAGDLVGVLAPGCDVARFYSLASSRRDGVLEICVRLRTGGVCSTFLHDLRIGDAIDAFVRENPAFRPARGAAPVILIGAGAGIAPLAGFVRGNARRRPMWLYFGARHPESDFLYRQELEAALGDKRLSALRPTFSRWRERRRVQSALAADEETLRALVARGAQILVCGGGEMARGVVETLSGVLAPLGLSVADLKREGRYVEDVY
jgi:sulfite reductase (NADPH) flavoprotein alpha-component